MKLVKWGKLQEEDRIQLISEQGANLRDLSSETTHSTPTALQTKNGSDKFDSSDNEANQEEEAVGKTKRKRTPFFLYVIMFFSIIGGFLFGYDTGVIAGALLELDKDYPLDATKKELLVSITVGAAALGAVMGGPLNEKLGRKKTIMGASIVFAVGAVVMAAAPSASWGWSLVLVGRFIVGIGIG